MALEMGAVDIEVIHPVILQRMNRVQRVISFASLRKQRKVHSPLSMRTSRCWQLPHDQAPVLPPAQENAALRVNLKEVQLERDRLKQELTVAKHERGLFMAERDTQVWSPLAWGGGPRHGVG
jgi:hypothetical protein